MCSSSGTRKPSSDRADTWPGLVDDLLDVARITHGKIVLQKERVLLGQVIEQALETCGPLIADRLHQLTVRLPEEKVWLEADPLRLVQVLCNLLSNSAKYTEPSGQISLTARCEQDQVVIRVRDTGIGIPTEVLPHVFEAFIQAPPALDRARGGLGLGLTMVRRLTEMHGGGVEAYSEGSGKGSEFVVRLPVAPAPVADAPQPVTATARDEPPRAGSPNGHPSTRRILVVDDNRDAAETLAELLEMWGYQVQTAPDGVTALQAACEFHPEVILLDLSLPGLDGYEVARRLRRGGSLNGALVVAMTGYAQEEARRRSQEAGFDHHLVKPVHPTELQQLLALLPADG